MNFSAKYPYAKPTGISLILHGALIGLFLLLGGGAPAVTLPVETIVIEVEILPSVVVDMREMAPVAAAAVPSLSTSVPANPPPSNPIPSLSTGPAEKPAQTQVLTTVDFQSLSSAMPGLASGISLAKPASSGAGVGSGTLGVTAVGGDGESRDEGGQTAAASLLYGPKPAYPQTARKARWEGAVVVHVLIDADGTVTAVSVREGSDHDVLDEAALGTLKKWRFSSATKDGVPVASVRDIRVRFRLEDEE